MKETLFSFQKLNNLKLLKGFVLKVLAGGCNEAFEYYACLALLSIYHTILFMYLFIYVCTLIYPAGTG